MLYGEAFRIAMDTFFDDRIRKEIIDEVIEATITIKNVEVK